MSAGEKYSCDYYVVGKPQKPKGFGVRHSQAFLLFMVLMVAYTMRSAMVVAILAMSDVKNSNPEIEVYNWDKQTQDILSSSFYWGYTLMQVPAGMLAIRFGGWYLLITVLAVNSIASVVTPAVAHYSGWQAVCAIRMLQGLTQGSLYPSMHTLISKWIPMSERGRVVNIAYSGSTVGTIVSMPFAGLMSSSAFGWPGIFYACGILSLISGIIWYFLGASTPAKHRKISLMEREFIEYELNQNTQNKKEVLVTPWAAILKSPPVLVLTITHVGFTWGFITMLTETPSYLKNVLGVDIEQSGLLTGVPYVFMWIISVLGSILNDHFINSKILSVAVTRKLLNSFGSLLPAICMAILTFLPKENTALGITFVTLCIGFSGTHTCGYMLNHMDLSPNFAGILMGMTNSVSGIVSIAAPIMAGYILNGHENDQTRWRIVFLVSATIVFVSNFIFMLFAKCDEQPWNRPPIVEEDIPEKLKLETFVSAKENNEKNDVEKILLEDEQLRGQKLLILNVE